MTASEFIDLIKLAAFEILKINGILRFENSELS